MFKKLRLKFILTNTLYVGVVLIVAIITICAFMYSNARSDMINAMRAFIENADAPHDMPDYLGERVESPEIYLPMCVYALSGDGEPTLIARRAADMSDAALARAVRDISQSEDDYGMVADRRVFYLRHTHAGETRVAFADSMYLVRGIRDVAVLMMVIYLIAMCLVIGISILVAKIALYSTENTWDEQKRFIADASHSLKTPLTVILANISILKNSEAGRSRESAQWLLSTEEEANGMRKLIDEMLILAQSDLNVRRQRFSEVNFSKLVQGLMLQFEALAFDKRIHMDAQIQSGVYLKGNDKALEQMVSALIDNAFKYEDEGGKVRVKLDKQVRRTVLSVYNASSYIEPEDRERIFGRFYRSKTESSVKRDGHGLGLAIARSVARAHSASIDVESARASGTEFRVVFRHIL